MWCFWNAHCYFRGQPVLTELLMHFTQSKLLHVAVSHSEDVPWNILSIRQGFSCLQKLTKFKVLVSAEWLHVSWASIPSSLSRMHQRCIIVYTTIARQSHVSLPFPNTMHNILILHSERSSQLNITTEKPVHGWNSERAWMGHISL